MLSKKKLYEILFARFEGDLCKRLCDLPMPSSLHNTKKSALRIKEAISSNELIAVVGDYDVDGVVSTLIMEEFLNACSVTPIIRLPNRFSDGYGLNENIVKQLSLQGVSLIITVDNGILAYEAANLAQKLGITLIISDHHSPGKTLPNAYAVINPKQDECNFASSEICGAQVAWYLVAAIKNELKISFEMSSFLDLLCVAIVADMMELKGLNRLLVKKGLTLLNKSKRPCIKALRENLSKDSFNYEDLGFLIAPLINCAGRMADAKMAYDFLRAKSLNEARKLLFSLQDLNAKRRFIEDEIFNLALKQISKSDNVIVVSSPSWHEGVLGIVASRLSKQYNLPSFVLCIKDSVAKGSARGAGGVDVLKLLENSKELLLSFGGHKGAAGVSLLAKNLDTFKQNLSKQLASITLEAKSDDSLGELDPCTIDWELIDILEYFEPYGQANPRPVFEFNNYCVKDIFWMGKNKTHVRLSICKNGRCFTAICFNCTKKFYQEMKLSFNANLVKNTFKGKSNIQLLITSFKDINE